MHYREPKKVETLEEGLSEEKVNIKELKEDNTKDTNEVTENKEEENKLEKYSLAIYKSPNRLEGYKRLEADSFEEVIEFWLKEFMENPARVSINAEEYHADKLIEWAKENEELIVEKIKEYGADKYINTNVFTERLEQSNTFGFTAGAPQGIPPFDIS